MSENTGETAVQQESAAMAEEKLGDAGKRAIDAERNARRAAEESVKSLTAQLDAIKKSQMSDLEKAQAAAQEAIQRAEAEAQNALRWRIAAKNGISDEDAETFLTGTDEASLTRQAERLKALAVAASTIPKPDLSQGGGVTPALNSDGLEQALKFKLGIA